MKPKNKAVISILITAALCIPACAGFNNWLNSSKTQAAIQSVGNVLKTAGTDALKDVASNGSVTITGAQVTQLIKDSANSAVVQLNSFPANTPVASAVTAVVQNSTPNATGQSAVSSALAVLPVNTTTAQASVILSTAANTPLAGN